MAVRKRKDDEPESLDNVIEAPIPQRQLTVSDVLRARRIECGLDIPHVAEVLRIRPAVLTAIEDGNFHLLPGPAYAIGFVRSYATFLGMDAEALVLRFKAEAAGVSHRPHLHFPLPIRDSRVPTGPLLVICVLLAFITYAGWYYVNSRSGQLADIVPTVPERLHHLIDPPRVLHAPVSDQTAPAETPAATASESETASSGSTTPAPASPTTAAPWSNSGAVVVGAGSSPAVDGVPPVDGRPETPAPAPPSQPDLAKPTTIADQGATNPATAYGAPEGQSRVVLRANADSWVQVRDKSGNLLFTRVLKPGEHYNVPNTAGLTLVAGNAGGLDVTVDGMAVPHIGEIGHVARNVNLDPDHLLAARPHAN